LGRPFTTWSLSKLVEYLADHQHIKMSAESVRQILRTAGIRWQATKTWKASRDPDFAAKMARILDLYDHPPVDRSDGRVICVDEFGPLNLQPRPGRGWFPTGLPAWLRATYNRTGGVRHMFAALDLASGQMFYREDTQTRLTTVGAREYDPLTGRFITVDPLLVGSDPQSLLGYVYANNNPMTMAEPTGLCPMAKGGGCVPGTGVTRPGTNNNTEDLAGGLHPKTKVPFDKDDYPDCSAYGHPEVADVRISLTGNRRRDERAANQATGMAETPDGYTWHHHQDSGLMQLVRSDVHGQTGHTGGYSSGK
jgi:RHS repeat-associated protein